MSLRRVLIIALAAVILSLAGWAGYGYFSPKNAMSRMTGWSAPSTATFRLRNSEGSFFEGELSYLFDLPASTLSDEAFCAFLNLPVAIQGSAERAKIPAETSTTPKLDGAPVCSRTEVNEKRKTALSIEATRQLVIVRWIYM